MIIILYLVIFIVIVILPCWAFFHIIAKAIATQDIKHIVLTIVAIVISLLFCWANIYTVLKTNDFMHAGGAALRFIGFVILLHALLLLMLIQAMKLPLGYMTFVWGFFIILYLLPFAKMKYDELEREKNYDKRVEAWQRVSRGTATMSDFNFLCKNQNEEIIFTALENGYNQIAKEVLVEVCDSLSDRIFNCNHSLLLSEGKIRVYGKEAARQIYLRALHYQFKEKGLTEEVEYLQATVPHIINIDYQEFSEMLYNLDLEYESRNKRTVSEK